MDVTETLQSGAKTLEALREHSKSPIKAIIYTHNHADHVFGAKVKFAAVLDEGHNFKFQASVKVPQSHQFRALQMKFCHFA